MTAHAWTWPDPEVYGDQWAHDYDLLAFVPPDVTRATVATLAELAAGGPVLEVAAGTGRVAVALAEAGVDVTATDASPKMLQRLREKDPAGLVRTRVEALPKVSGGPYAVIAVLVNSLWVLRTAEEQQRFLANAAARLTPTGVVVVEISIVDPRTWSRPKRIDADGLIYHRTSVWDPDTHQVCHTFHLPASMQPQRRDVYLRYLTRDELLGMAAAAGLVPRYEWSAWDRTPFGPDSRLLVAVLQRADPATA